MDPWLEIGILCLGGCVFHHESRTYHSADFFFSDFFFFFDFTSGSVASDLDLWLFFFFFSAGSSVDIGVAAAASASASASGFFFFLLFFFDLPGVPALATSSAAPFLLIFVDRSPASVSEQAPCVVCGEHAGSDGRKRGRSVRQVGERHTGIVLGERGRDEALCSGLRCNHRNIVTRRECPMRVRASGRQADDAQATTE
jgi:hypothetical protein